MTENGQVSRAATASAFDGIEFLLDRGSPIPLYYQFAPLPDDPVRLGNYFAIIWIVLGFVALGFAAARRPQAWRGPRTRYAA